MAIEYKYECYWSQHDGYHFSFGTKRFWQCSRGFIVADVIEKNKEEEYKNHEHFEHLENALDYMRHGKR